MFVEYEYLISTFGFFVNVFHLTVLTQKSMRTNSVNVILIGIAVNDLYSLLVPGIQKIDSLFRTCVLPPSADRIFFTLIMLAVRFETRRSATWLSLSMAVIRTAVASNTTSTRVRTYTHPLFGLIIVLVTVLVSSTFTVLHIIRQEIVQNGTFVLTENCEDIPENTQMPTFTLSNIPLFAANRNLLAKVLISFDSVVSRVLPCLLFPIVTYLLIRELRKATDNRRRLSFEKPDKNGEGRTTRLVTYLTITFFVAEFPLGILYLVQANTQNPVLFYQIACVMDFFFILLDANATSHCFICLAMSSQYRTTVASILKIDPNRMHKNSIQTVS